MTVNSVHEVDQRKALYSSQKKAALTDPEKKMPSGKLTSSSDGVTEKMHLITEKMGTFSSKIVISKIYLPTFSEI